MVGDDDLGQGRSVLGCNAVGDNDLSRALLGVLGSSSLSLSLSLSLSARERVSLSLSFLSVFRKYFEVKMKA